MKTETFRSVRDRNPTGDQKPGVAFPFCTGSRGGGGWFFFFCCQTKGHSSAAVTAGQPRSARVIRWCIKWAALPAQSCFMKNTRTLDTKQLKTLQWDRFKSAIQYFSADSQHQPTNQILAAPKVAEGTKKYIYMNYVFLRLLRFFFLFSLF